MTLSIHNTSQTKPLILKRIDYFDTSGALVQAYLPEPVASNRASYAACVTDLAAEWRNRGSYFSWSPGDGVEPVEQRHDHLESCS